MSSPSSTPSRWDPDSRRRFSNFPAALCLRMARMSLPANTAAPRAPVCHSGDAAGQRISFRTPHARPGPTFINPLEALLSVEPMSTAWTAALKASTSIVAASFDFVSASNMDTSASECRRTLACSFGSHSSSCSSSEAPTLRRRLTADVLPVAWNPAWEAISCLPLLAQAPAGAATCAAGLVRGAGTGWGTAWRAVGGEPKLVS